VATKRGGPPVNPFARAKPAPLGQGSAPSVFRRAQVRAPPPSATAGLDVAALDALVARQTAEDTWAASLPPPSPMTPQRLQELRSADYLADLEREGLSKRNLAKLRKLQPGAFYFVTMTLKGYQSKGDDAADDGGLIEDYSEDRSVAFQGRGSAIIRKVHYLATVQHCDIVNLEIWRVDESKLSDQTPDLRPVWTGEMITLHDGRAVGGTGIRFSKRRKPGPRKRPLTVNRRKFLDRERKAAERADKRPERYQEILRTKGKKAADDYARRSKAGQRGAKTRGKPKQKSKGSVFSRMIPHKPRKPRK
jgi:hypothetical protein